MAKEAAQIWIGPKQQVVRAEPEEAGDDDDAPGRRELRQRFWSGLNDYLVAEHPDLPDFEVRPNWTIRLPSGIRHIGAELRFSVRHRHAGIDIWFWRDASFPIWDRIRVSPNPYNDLVNASWDFEKVEGRSRARMFVNRSIVDLRNESSWLEVYRWLGEKLSLVYEKVLPRLREEMDQNEAVLAGTRELAVTQPSSTI